MNVTHSIVMNVTQPLTPRRCSMKTSIVM